MGKVRTKNLEYNLANAIGQVKVGDVVQSKWGTRPVGVVVEVLKARVGRSEEEIVVHYENDRKGCSPSAYFHFIGIRHIDPKEEFSERS